LKTVLFLCDAFRSNYLSEEYTPFLFNCSRNGIYVKNIIPSGGFCERTEIFNGQKPNESGFFTAIGFDPENSPYKDKIFLSFLGKIELQIYNLLKRMSYPSNNELKLFFRMMLIRVYFYNNIRLKFLKPYKIPLFLLKYFNLTEDEFDFFENSINIDKSIFNDIVGSGKNIFTQSFTSLRMNSNSSDSENIQKAINASNDNFSFYPIYIGEIDQTGHLFGPHSKELKKAIAKLDLMVENCVSQFLKKDSSTNFIFLGDHGMTTVKKIIDFEKIIDSISNRTRLKLGHDFIYFLDSTMVRIWFLNTKSKESLKNEVFSNQILLENGVFINKKIANTYSIPENDRRYGDMIWWANNGILIFPDFFHTGTPYKGMHGYKPDTNSTFGTCITWGKNVSRDYSDEQELIYVYDLIKKVNAN